MNWRDEILSGLPAPRGDEPASLRRDIEDELADHLHCAMQRERVTAHDDETARRAVLARFGNPRRIAYRLWWDAMKEKIMKDRLMMGALVMLTLASLAALGLSWTALQRNQQANAAIVEKLDSLSAQLEKSTIPPNQSILKLRVVDSGNPSRPLVGVNVRIVGVKSEETGDYNKTHTTDSSGQIKANLRPGSYVVECAGLKDSTAREIMGGYSIKKEIKLFGGEMSEETFPIPAGELVSAPGRFRVAVDWPSDLDALNRQERAPGEYLISYTIDRPQVKIPGVEISSTPISFVVTPQGEIRVGESISTPNLHRPLSPSDKISIEEQYHWRQGLISPASYGPPQSNRGQAGNKPVVQKAGELILHPGEYEVLGVSVQRRWPSFESDSSPQAQTWGEHNLDYRPLFRFTVPAQERGNMRLPISETLRKQLYATFQSEAMFDVKKEPIGDIPENDTDQYYFHDLRFSITNFWSTEKMLCLFVTRLSGKPDSKLLESLTAGQTVTFEDTQFILEQITPDPGISPSTGSARIRAKRLARPASAAPVTTSTQPAAHP